MPKFNPPEQFNFSSPNEWPEWKQRFSRFRIATKLNKEDGEIQVSSLIYAMGRQAEFVFTSFSFDNEEMRNNFDEVMKKFNEHFIPQRNTIHERAKFHLRIQRQGENVETFVRSLYELSEHCQFGETKDEMIRDRLVIGLTDKESSQKMQLERTLTLDVAIQMARQFEMVKSQISTQQIVDVEEIKKYGRPYVPKKKSFSQRNSRQKTNDSARSEFKGKCKLCSRQHGDRDDCPAPGKKCRKCHKIGHFEVVCRSSRAVHEITAEEENYFLGSITRDKSTVDVPWQVQLKLYGKFISFKIDTGADISVISKDTYLSLNRRPQLIPPDAVLNSPGGKLKCMGFLSANVTHKKKPYDVKLYIVEGSNNLLSRSAATMMGLVFRVEEVNQSIFGDFGLVDCEPVKITLKENAVPYAVVHTSRRVPFPILPKVKEELMRMQEAGIIEEITTPTDWCAPMVPVIKKIGRIRICVDLKKLNNSVKRERYQLPTFDDIAHKLAGSTVFSKLDASSGFYQVPLDEASSHLTCFITPFGRYCFKRVPFGITSAPEIFQRKMNEMMKGLDGVEALMDDTLIYGRTVEEHDHRFDQAIRRITDSGMKLNKSKILIK